jgi:hypothetical protein
MSDRTLSYRSLPPKTQHALKSHGVVISEVPNRVPGVVSFALTGALCTGAFLLTFGAALAAGRGEAAGNYYYDRYALPYVTAYAPPDTAPGTYGRADDGEFPRGSRNHY